MSRRDEFLKELAIKRARDMNMEIILSAVAVTLKKEYGFGQNRIARVLQGIETEVLPIGSGMIDYETYKEYAESFTGVSIGRFTER